jgi:hypothetical protein
MNETKREEILEIAGSGRFDLAFQNPGIKEIAEALLAVLNKQRVILIFTEDIERGDYMVPVSTLPVSTIILPFRWIMQKRLKQWSGLSPHLFRPVKTIYAGWKIPAARIKFTDLLWGNNFTQKSSRLTLSDIAEPGHHLSDMPDGWAFQEYMVNVTRLKMEMLKEIHKLKGVVLNYAELESYSGNLSVIDKLSQCRLSIGSLAVKAGKPLFRDVFATPDSPWPGFSMQIKSKGGRIFLYDCGENLIAGSEPETCEEELLKVIQSLQRRDLTIPIVKQKIREESRIFRNRLPLPLKNLRLENAAGGTGHRPVEDLTETAFDLAKQTGIGFQEFRKLFLRYGLGIDWITERAYEWMATTRDPQKIWDQAEKEFSAWYEWGNIK